MVLTEAKIMKITIAGPKLDRLIYLLENESNAKVLGDKLIAQTVTGATATNVREVGGTHLEYRFKLPTDTTTGWLKKRAMRITKKFIDDFNEAAQATYDALVAANQNPDELDPDSDETRIAQATAWIRFNVRGGSKDIDVDNDLVEVIALSGVITAANFLIQVKEAGQIVENPKTFQQRLKATRLDIKTVLPEDPIVITSLNHTEIRQQLITALQLPPVTEGHEVEVRRLFEEDVVLQMIHYKVGSRYTAVISNVALDYYGEVNFIIGGDVPVEPTYPMSTNANYSNVDGHLNHNGTGNYYLFLDEFDPAIENIIVSSPSLEGVIGLFTGFSLTILGKNPGDMVEFNDVFSGSHQRQVTKQLNSVASYDNTLTPFDTTDYEIELDGDTMNVKAIGTSADPAVTENRVYTMPGFGAAPASKLQVKVLAMFDPTKVQNPTNLMTIIRRVPKVAP